MRIQLSHHFDDDLRFLSRPQHRIERRQGALEAHVDDAAANGRDRTETCAWIVRHASLCAVPAVVSVRQRTQRLISGTIAE
jgi:hypothetical protein